MVRFLLTLQLTSCVTPGKLLNLSGFNQQQSVLENWIFFLDPTFFFLLWAEWTGACVHPWEGS